MNYLYWPSIEYAHSSLIQRMNIDSPCHHHENNPNDSCTDALIIKSGVPVALPTASQVLHEETLIDVTAGVFPPCLRAAQSPPHLTRQTVHSS